MIHDPLNTSSTQNLEKTKKRLSAIFACVVFAISIILISIFLSYKYTITSKTDKTQFYISGDEIAKNISDHKSFLDELEGKRRDFGREKPGKDTGLLRTSLFSNFIIIENETNEAIYWNINKNFDVNALAGARLDKGFFIQDSIMVRIVPLSNLYEGKSLIVFREVRYTFNEYITDLLRFIILALLSSILFYLIGLKFVSQILKPVEYNLNDMRDFIHNAGHELKTPLSVIHGNLQLLGELKKYDKDLTLESITEIEKLDKLIQSLVDLSDIQENNENENIDLHTEIESIIKDFGQKVESKKIKIEYSTSSKPTLFINREYFYIFFSNILGNAIKYNKNKGNIQIKLKAKSFTIKDTGIGIAEEKQDKIFERFYKAGERNSEGYGIGLSLVKKISDLYGWKIDVKSKENEGTEVLVKFK